MYKIIKIFFLKEVKEAMRDKRSLRFIIGLSIAMPLFMLGGLMFQSVMNDKAATMEYNIVGGEQAPSLISFLNAQGFITTEKESSEGVQLYIPDDFKEKISLGILPTLKIRANVSDSREAVRNLQDSLGDYTREIAISRLMARGISPLALKPFKIDLEDTSEVSIIALYLAPMMIFMFLMAPIYALIPAGIDCTAGERERHGLLPLLLQPVHPISITLGKFLMLVLWGLASLALATGSGFIAFSNFTIEGMNLGFDMSFVTWILFLLISLPTVMLLAAMIMGFASFAKTFKEGQTYVNLTGMLPMLLMGLGLTLDEPLRAHFPLWSEVLVLRSLLTGDEMVLLPWLGTVAGYFVIIAASLIWMSRSIRKHALEGA